MADLFSSSAAATPDSYDASAIEGQTFRTFEIYITISLLYLALVTLVTWGLLLVPGAREQPAHGFGDA